MKAFFVTLSSALVALVTATAIPVVVEERAPQEIPSSAENAAAVYVSITENQLVDSQCANVTVIFARGTAELGNVGALVGPPFFNALSDDIGGSNLIVQGVDYSADVIGFLEGGDSTGSSTMASLVSQAASQCPGTNIVLSGYSQGGQLVHNAASQLNATMTALISSVVIFGDPDNGSAVGSIPSSKVLVICHDTDNICQHGDLILASHLDYSINATAAASFVAQQAGF